MTPVRFKQTVQKTVLLISGTSADYNTNLATFDRLRNFLILYFWTRIRISTFAA